MNARDPRTIDISFCPVDDISYHNEKKQQKGIRGVQVLPYIGIRTIYLAERNYPTLCNALDVSSKESIDVFKSEEVTYKSDGIPKTMTVIYSTYNDKQQPCVLLNGKELIIANSCIIVGEDFSDLSINQCYALVTSARAIGSKETGCYSACVNIRDDMDLIPRVIMDEE